MNTEWVNSQVLFIDSAIFPRARVDKSIVKEYKYALLSSSCEFPLIEIDDHKRILTGCHTWHALKELVDAISAGNLQPNAIKGYPCDTTGRIKVNIASIPSGDEPIVYCYRANLTHGRRPTPADRKAVILKLYDKDPGRASDFYAAQLGIPERTARHYLSEAKSEFNRRRREIIRQGLDSGKDDDAIGADVETAFPWALGNSKRNLRDLIRKIREDPARGSGKVAKTLKNGQPQTQPGAIAGAPAATTLSPAERSIAGKTETKIAVNQKADPESVSVCQTPQGDDASDDVADGLEERIRRASEEIPARIPQFFATNFNLESWTVYFSEEIARSQRQDLIAALNWTVANFESGHPRPYTVPWEKKVCCVTQHDEQQVVEENARRAAERKRVLNQNLKILFRRPLSIVLPRIGTKNTQEVD